ncbi:MAG: ATP-binding protein [Bacillota bacterium]|nr:ATP-binding protein [Bacillota bacterium]
MFLPGANGEKQMREIISTTYFEEPAGTYLCLADGTVFSSSNNTDPPENIITSLRQREGADQTAVEMLADALENGSSGSLTYSNAHGTNAAYVTKLPGKDWTLLQVFPIKVTNAMLNESNAMAVYLELWLILLFAGYILILVVENRRQKAKLTMEKQEMRDIVESTSQLFTRFVLVDLKNDSYEYLKTDVREPGEADGGDSGEKLPQNGIYSQLRNYWNARLIQEDEHVRNQLTIRSIQRDLTEDTPYLQYEYRLHDDGIRWDQIFVLCLKRENSVPISVLMAIQDVTELKEAELQKRIAMEDAYLAAKAANEAKSTFLSNMSHDMRTPMNAIIGFSTLLDRDAEQPDKVREYGGKIVASGQHLLRLINDVLDMSKIESGKNTLNIAAFSLAELLEELNAVTQPKVREKKQTLRVKVCDVEGDHFLGDRLRLSQILLNLLSNALKYTQEGGHIELTILGLPQVSKGYAHLRFQVQDNGIGMRPEFVEHIFDPFSREHNSTVSGIQGTGLGMTITKNLVDLMGGTISVESVPGEGSTFQVELELRYGERSAETGRQRPEALPSSGGNALEGLRMLVAEDNNINAEILEELLSCEGVSCERTVNGQEALERFRQTPPDYYDAVLMDIQMPVMNGYETARAIRDLDRPDGKTIPIVAMTANAFADDVQHAMEAGMNAHISKPIDMVTLRSALEKLIHPGSKN